MDSYGLIHNDFNDGNFTVDYDNGDITVFDFDDCCYFWFIYDLACAWESGIGRVMFRPLAERKDFMNCYMEDMMAGYNKENTLSAEWLAWPAVIPAPDPDAGADLLRSIPGRVG